MLLNPFEYYMKHIWGSVMTNEEVSHRYKSIIQDLIETKDISEICKDLKNLPHQFMHEFVRRLILIVIEKNSADKTNEYTDLAVKVLIELTHQLMISVDQIQSGIHKAADSIEDLILDVPSAAIDFEVISKLIKERKELNPESN